MIFDLYRPGAAIDPVIRPAKPRVAEIIWVLVGILFGTLPANRAARLDPVQTLKYE